MKSIKKHIYVLLTATCLALTTACEDLAFGEKFLQKPPSTDVTIDTIFSTAEYARRVLWYSYTRMPMGIDDGNRQTGMDICSIEGLTDLCHSIVGYGGVEGHYYSGSYNAAAEDNFIDGSHNTKFRFYNFGAWQCIRHAWILIENVDKVPDMSASEKLRLKAEAKTVIATYYAYMFRHYGGLPILDRSLDVDVLDWPKRATVDETVKFIVRLCDEAIATTEFPWALPADERANWDGRVTKAAAAGLKLRTLLFAASPLFNNAQAYHPGVASDQHLTWYGDYQKSRWEDARKAGEDFFRQLSSGGYYKLVKKEDTSAGTYRQAFQDAYFTRSVPELIISVRRNIYTTSNIPRLDQAVRWGGFCPTKEYFDMFPMADGSDFDWNNPEHRANPFINRDPRLNETILLDNDNYQGRKCEVYQELATPQTSYPDGGALAADKDNYPKGRDWMTGKLGNTSLGSGIAGRKFALDRGGEFTNRLYQYPHMRLAEMYLSYAEALNECDRTSEAFPYVNEVRARVGLKPLSGLNKEQLREAILRERALEFGWEDVRFFDLIRWKREDIFTKKLTGLNIYKNKNTGEYKFSILALPRERAWWKTNGFSPKWYLSAFPAQEINKNYGLIQNPGWE